MPTRLVLYPGASHLFILDGAPSHRLDFNRRIVDWVEQYAGDASGAQRPRLDAAHWQRRLAVLAARHRVPGASLGILRMHDRGADELVDAAYGVLNKDTGVEATTDSIFQIGSISKVWTATVVMQLVDEGLLDLDTPIIEVLPELRLADPDVTKHVTMRHLLTHTSGIDGDVFTDTGRGDDCLEKYVAGLGEVKQNHPLGATWSYCNSGFSVMGRRDREADRAHLGCRAARADLHAARPAAHGHPARGRAAVPRRRRPRRRGRERAAAGAGLGAAALARPGRADHVDRC